MAVTRNRRQASASEFRPARFGAMPGSVPRPCEPFVACGRALATGMQLDIVTEVAGREAGAPENGRAPERHLQQAQIFFPVIATDGRRASSSFFQCPAPSGCSAMRRRKSSTGSHRRISPDPSGSDPLALKPWSLEPRDGRLPPGFEALVFKAFPRHRRYYETHLYT